ncbi:Dps family protein [Kitasatospora griseola]|uniref:Dps family protein n=1 Tax=Kitasatospora griseola TaxID=2064 RepID=UPI0036673B0F
MSSQPRLHRHSPEIRAFGTVTQLPIALSHDARQYSCQRLNRILADTQFLYALYKKHHWGVRGPTFYHLRLLLDRHAQEQLDLVEVFAERVHSLGGVAVGDPRHAAEITGVPRPLDGVEDVPAVLSRLLDAHEAILAEARDAATRTVQLGDDSTQDLLVSQVIRTGEAQVWSLAEHLVVTPRTGA